MRALRSVFAFSPWLVSATLASALLAIVLGIASIFDTHLVVGAPALYKPIKFAISFAVYGISLIWFLGLVKKHTRLAKGTAFFLAWFFVVELVIITIQALRGTTSHFNESTPFDAQLFGIMGVFVILAWLMTVATMLLLLIERLPDSTFTTSLCLSLAVAAISMVVTTSVMLMQNTHAIGLADGGPGLPFLGWSTVGGDLRISHFFGLHAVQIIPLAAFSINRQRRLSLPRKNGLVWVVSFSYLGGVLLLFWQALRGQSIVAPDVITLSAFVGFLSLALGVGYVLCHPSLRRNGVVLSSIAQQN